MVVTFFFKDIVENVTQTFPYPCVIFNGFLVGRPSLEVLASRWLLINKIIKILAVIIKSVDIQPVAPLPLWVVIDVVNASSTHLAG